MVRFLPFDRTDDEGINIVLQHIDFSIQYGEDLEFKEPKVMKRFYKYWPKYNLNLNISNIYMNVLISFLFFVYRTLRKSQPI